MFDGAEFRLILLLLLEDQPRHGYDLIREIEARAGGAYSPSPGVIYPTLTLLEEVGHVAIAAAEGAKKLHVLTDEGRAHLAERRAEAEAALARLDTLRQRGEAFDSGPVSRAMSNLKAALQERIAGPVERELLLWIADLLDEAARKIERL